MQLGVVLNKDRQHLSVLLDNIPETTTRGECSHCPQKYLLQIKVVGGIFFFQWLFAYRKYPIYSHTLITYLKYDHNNRKVMQIPFRRKKGTLIITTLLLKFVWTCFVFQQKVDVAWVSHCSSLGQQQGYTQHWQHSTSIPKTRFVLPSLPKAQGMVLHFRL